MISLITCSNAFFTLVRTEMGWVGGGNAWALTRPPWRGLMFCKVLDWRWLCVFASCNPLCDYPVQLKILCWKQAAEHRGLQKDSSVWVLLLTTRASPQSDLMGPTYVVITMPTSCQLWCSDAFALQTDASVSCLYVPAFNKSPPQRSHQSKCFSSSLRLSDRGEE